MVSRSSIAWTDYGGGDANFVLRGKRLGDCECSPGCANCYARGLRNRNPKAAPDQTTYDLSKLRRLARSRFEPGDEPYRRGLGSRPMCFVCDMGDIAHPNVPDDVITQALDMLGSRPDVDWQVLTKRAGRMAGLLDGSELPPNVWYGVTVENQRAADERLPLLRRVSAVVRFVSVEPMLGPVRLDLAGVHWVIIGGESGPKRRPFDKAWAGDLVAQCRAAGVAVLFKQGSAPEPGRDDLLDGRRVREWPA